MSVGGGQTYTIDTVPDHVRNLNIIKARLDAFTLGLELAAEEDSTASQQSINHWVWSFVVKNDKSVRFSMESIFNVAVNKYGVLRIKAVSYEGKARSVVKSWEFRTATITIGHIVDLIKLYGLEKFEMVEVDGGKFKGCRHWSKVLGEFIQSHRWTLGVAANGEALETFLPYVYTVQEDGNGNLVELKKTPLPIDEGNYYD